MIQVVLIGNGNLATHLCKALDQSSDSELLQCYSRNPFELANSLGISYCNRLDDLMEADLYLLAISDVAIASVSSQLPFEGRLVVHSSGSVPMSAIDDRHRRGVFYPVQSFSKERNINFQEIPIGLEAEYEKDHHKLHTLASSLSNRIHTMNSTQRNQLHLAAVFANNFTNHLYQQAEMICHNAKLPPDLLYPLIQETALKIKKMTPMQAQTGPARRLDHSTIARHLKSLEGQSKELYQALTQSILNTYEKKL